MANYPSVNLTKAKRQARAAGKWRGHDLGKWQPSDYWPYKATATCRRCGAIVCADGDPPPNGIDVGGDGVALNCLIET